MNIERVRRTFDTWSVFLNANVSDSAMGSHARNKIRTSRRP